MAESRTPELAGYGRDGRRGCGPSPWAIAAAAAPSGCPISPIREAVRSVCTAVCCAYRAPPYKTEWGEEE
jgi:hypothetical protein